MYNIKRRSRESLPQHSSCWLTDSRHTSNHLFRNTSYLAQVSMHSLPFWELTSHVQKSELYNLNIFAFWSRHICHTIKYLSACLHAVSCVKILYCLLLGCLPCEIITTFIRIDTYIVQLRKCATNVDSG